MTAKKVSYGTLFCHIADFLYYVIRGCLFFLVFGYVLVEYVCRVTHAFHARTSLIKALCSRRGIAANLGSFVEYVTAYDRTVLFFEFVAHFTH